MIETGRNSGEAGRRGEMAARQRDGEKRQQGTEGENDSNAERG